MPWGSRVSRRVANWLTWASGMILALVFVLNIAQIVARPVNGGWIWINDLSRLLVTWMIMVGAAGAIGLNEHLVVDFLQERMPDSAKRGVGYLVSVIQFVLGVVLLFSGTVVAMKRMKIEYIQLGIPTGYAYFAVPTLGFFMLLFSILMLGQDASSSAEIDEGNDAR